MKVFETSIDEKDPQLHNCEVIKLEKNKNAFFPPNFQVKMIANTLKFISNERINF